MTRPALAARNAPILATMAQFAERAAEIVSIAPGAPGGIFEMRQTMMEQPA